MRELEARIKQSDEPEPGGPRRLRRHRLGTVLALGAILLLAGFLWWTTRAEPSHPTDVPPIDRSTEFPAHIRVEAEGTESFLWEGVHTLTLNQIGRAEDRLRWVSVGLTVTIPLEANPRLRFRWAFDLIGKYRDQPGTFTLGEDAAVPDIRGGGLPDMAFFVLLKVRADAQDEFQVHDWDQVEYLKEFTQIAEPCTVRLGATLESGSVACPDLRTADGEVAAFTATWHRTGQSVQIGDETIG